jgi:hypothetical protein
MKTTRKTAADAPALSLPQRLQAGEMERHAGRLASIKSMHARLVLLDALMPAIEEADICLDLGMLSSHGGKALWLRTDVMNYSGAARLVNVLLASGMALHERKNYPPSGGCMVYLKKGRLQVAVYVDQRAVHLLEVPACA